MIELIYIKNRVLTRSEHVRKILKSLIIKLVTLNAVKRKIIFKFMSQRFWINLLASYHLLLNTSHLIFHFFTIPCLRQHFYPLGILAFKINELKSFTFWRTKLKGWNLHLQLLSIILHLPLASRRTNCHSFENKFSLKGKREPFVWPLLKLSVVIFF